MKVSMEDFSVEDATDGSRRGLFRRGRRSADGGSDHTMDHGGSGDHVATMDDIARRMDELTGGSSVSDQPVSAEIDMQRAVIARANDLAATSSAANGVKGIPVPDAIAQPNAPEATMQQTAPMIDPDIEARMDAALSPAAPTRTTSTPAVAAPSMSVPPPVAASYVPIPTGDDAVSVLGIDINRVVRMIQEEASSVRQRMELEIRDAHVQATDIVDRAEAEAENIREHGQSQARVLLGEVEEIISEAQQTGEQILHRASEEASNLRKEATAILQQAQTEARGIIESSRRDGEQVLAEQRRLATVRAQEAMREQDRLKDQIRRLEERRRQVLESLEPLISQLTQMMPAGIDHNVVQLERQRASVPQG